MVFFQVTFDSPKWRSPNPWKGHLKPPRRSLGRTRWTKPSLLCSSRYFSMGVICFFLITKVFLELGRSPSERTNPSTNSGSVFVMSSLGSGIPKDTCENGPNAPWDLKCLPRSYHNYHGILECTPWKINMELNNEGFEEVTFKVQPLIFTGCNLPARWRIWKTIVFLLGWHCFRCHVSFREGKQHTANGWAPGIFIVEIDILFNTIIVVGSMCLFSGCLWCKQYMYLYYIIYIYNF